MGRLHREVMLLLVQEIAAGTRTPGEMLPREVDLAEEYEISRGVAREVIRALEERGLVTVRHGVGATVNPAERWDLFDADVLGAVLDTGRGSDILAEYLECRRVLEVEAAGLAAERATVAQRRQISAALAEMEAAVAEAPVPATERRFHEADVHFHQTVMAASGNRALGMLAERIHAALLVARFPLARPEYRVTRALPEHRRIHEAIADGDPAAARAAMQAHLDTVGSYLQEHRRAGSDPSRGGLDRDPTQ